MASRTLPNLGLKGFWALGEDNYKTDMDTNLLALSVLAQAGAIDLVAALPGSPVNGDVYVLDDTAGGDANKIAVRDAGAWTLFVPSEGWMVYNRADGNYLKFDGTAWVTLTVNLPDPTGNAGMFLAVKMDESGYELVDAPGQVGAEFATANGWRIIADAPGSDGTNAGWGEIAFYDSLGEVVFLSGVLDVSSEAVGFISNNLIDSNTSAGNGWKADIPGTEDAAGSYAGIIFASPVQVSGVMLWPINGDPGSAPESFRVQYYDDGTTTWMDAGTFTATWPDNGEQYFPLTPIAESPTLMTAEQVRDTVAAMLTAGSGVTLTYDDSGDTLTVAATVSLDGYLQFAGDINCSANPNYPAATVGDTYLVSADGKIGGAAGVNVEIGDSIICKADNAGGTEAAVGASWFVLNRNIDGGGGSTAPFSLGWGFGPAPIGDETLFLYTFVENVDFADDWSGSSGACGANPTASYVMTVAKNGASVGTVTVSTAGALSFATTGGAINFAAGDVLKVSGGADDTVADISVTFKGTRA